MKFIFHNTSYIPPDSVQCGEFSMNQINLDIFPEKMKIAKVTPIFKSGKKELLTKANFLTFLFL